MVSDLVVGIILNPFNMVHALGVVFDNKGWSYWNLLNATWRNALEAFICLV